ncbi:MAG: hypothetical protein PHW04_07865 [Candidatus Wallbacteria bacterium]|nr:hypothetical protein [Candidatus Wallbacteria bacterium]
MKNSILILTIFILLTGILYADTRDTTAVQVYQTMVDNYNNLPAGTPAQVKAELKNALITAINEGVKAGILTKDEAAKLTAQIKAKGLGFELTEPDPQIDPSIDTLAKCTQDRGKFAYNFYVRRIQRYLNLPTTVSQQKKDRIKKRILSGIDSAVKRKLLTAQEAEKLKKKLSTGKDNDDTARLVYTMAELSCIAQAEKSLIRAGNFDRTLENLYEDYASLKEIVGEHFSQLATAHNLPELKIDSCILKYLGANLNEEIQPVRDEVREAISSVLNGQSLDSLSIK